MRLICLAVFAGLIFKSDFPIPEKQISFAKKKEFAGRLNRLLPIKKKKIVNWLKSYFFLSKYLQTKKDVIL